MNKVELRYINVNSIRHIALRLVNILYTFDFISDEVRLSAFLEFLGTVSPEILKLYVKELPWFKKSLTSTKENIRELSAKIYAFILTYSTPNEFESHVIEMINYSKNKLVDVQHGALLALSHIMERKLTILKQENAEEILKLEVYSTAVNIICKL